MPSIKTLIAGIALSTGFALNAFAAPVTINLAPNTSTNVWKFNYTSTAANLEVTGWSNNSSGKKNIVQDKIGRWSGSGIGVENANSPQHAIDNSNGDYDALLFSFNKVVDLTNLSIGWAQTDADVSVLAYTGTTPFAGNLNNLGNNWATLLNNGWSVVGNYNRNGSGSFAINADDFQSQYWLVGAYNSAYGATSRANGLTNNNDYFKLKSVTFDVPVVKVPESSTLALLLLGLVGLGFARRRAA